MLFGLDRKLGWEMELSSGPGYVLYASGLVSANLQMDVILPIESSSQALRSKSNFSHFGFYSLTKLLFEVGQH